MFKLRILPCTMLTLCLLVCNIGCHRHYLYERPSVSAVAAQPHNQIGPPGIPFYLPKPLLVVSKNFHHIHEYPVGFNEAAQISGFDKQETYANVNMQAKFSRTSESASSIPERGLDQIPSNNRLSPGRNGIPNDGLAPETFFTYELVFVPDLSQKYSLKLEGGAGEMRAAMNLVNGWQFTGLGPYYFKDSSSAQNLISRGIALNLGLGGVADVVNSAANLGSALSPERSVTPDQLRQLAEAIEMAKRVPTFDTSLPRGVLSDYAEISVYEPRVTPEGNMEWIQIVGKLDEASQQMKGLRFDREYLGRFGAVTGEPRQSRAVDLVSSLIASGSRSQDSQPRLRDDLLGEDIGSNPVIGALLQNTLKPVAVPKKCSLFRCFRSKAVNQEVDVTTSQ